MRMQRFAVGWAAMFLLLSSGCASFRGGNVAPVKSMPAVSGEKPSISVVLNGRVHMGGEVKDAVPQMLEKWTNYVLEAYRQSGLFSVVRSGLSESDLRAEVTIDNSGDPNMGLAFLSGLTMTIIPAKATDDLAMTTVFKDAEGAERARVKKSDSIDTWIQLFMVFLMPARWPGSVVEDVFTDLARATLAEAAERGVFTDLLVDR